MEAIKMMNGWDSLSKFVKMEDLFQKKVFFEFKDGEIFYRPANDLAKVIFEKDRLHTLHFQKPKQESIMIISMQDVKRLWVEKYSQADLIETIRYHYETTDGVGQTRKNGFNLQKD